LWAIQPGAKRKTNPERAGAKRAREHTSTRQLNHISLANMGGKKENWARNEEIQASIAQQNVRHQVSDALLLLCIQNFKYATMNFAYRW
jgi:hypothetical protein